MDDTPEPPGTHDPGVPSSSSDAPRPVEPEPPHWSLWALYLFFRPRLFFNTFVLQSVPALTVITAWIYGIAGAIDRIETRALLGELRGRQGGLYELLREDWAFYWGFAAVAGIAGGALYYGIGGWWYRLRLRWSGAQRPDPYLSRRVYVYASQAYALPLVLYTAWETTAYATPLTAASGDDLGALLVIAAVFWSVYVSYRGVRTAFVVRKWAARVWFFVLPALIYSVALLALVVGLWATGLLEDEPDVDHPRSLEREAFSLRYPGNWEVDTEDEDYDPDASFSIGPVFADATFQFWFYAESVDSRDCVDQTLENLSTAYEFEGLEQLERWGRFAGAGYRGRAAIEGSPYEFLMFCSTDGEPPFEIMRVAERRGLDRMQPGFALIRDTLELRSPATP